MKFYILLIIAINFSICLFAQEEHRRANYFDTFIEIKDSIDSISIVKSTREMKVFHEGTAIKKYIISLGEEPIGKKQFEGDMRTPEGLYYINERSDISTYHKNLGLNYPSVEDSTFAAIQGKSAGGEIKIHGFPNNHRKIQERDFLNRDWTIGCIAISDFEIDELFIWVKTLCPILILP